VLPFASRDGPLYITVARGEIDTISCESYNRPELVFSEMLKTTLMVVISTFAPWIILERSLRRALSQEHVYR